MVLVITSFISSPLKCALSQGRAGCVSLVFQCSDWHSKCLKVWLMEWRIASAIMQKDKTAILVTFGTRSMCSADLDPDEPKPWPCDPTLPLAVLQTRWSLIPHSRLMFILGLWRFLSKISTQLSSRHSGLGSVLATQSIVASLPLCNAIILRCQHHWPPNLTWQFIVPPCPRPLHLLYFPQSCYHLLTYSIS